MNNNHSPKTSILLKDIDRELHHRLKVRCAEENKSIRGLILELIKKYLEEGRK